jgi:hypothetical protein
MRGGHNWTGRERVEAYRSLDVNSFWHAGCLKPGYRSGWWWGTADGERTASIGLAMDAGCLTLTYRQRDRGDGEWTPVTEAVSVDVVPCRFGGARPFFVCPGRTNGRHCGRRVLKLYMRGSYFLCRHCARLGYQSQLEHSFGRALQQANRIRMKLGGNPGMASPFPEKPKGMHWRTYERLERQVWETEAVADAHLIYRFQRLMG